MEFTSYLTLTQRFLEENSIIKKNLVSPGDTSRTIEHNYTLSKIYSLNWHLNYVFKILIAKVNQFISPILPKKIKNFLYLIQKNFFFIKIFNLYNKFKILIELPLRLSYKKSSKKSCVTVY